MVRARLSDLERHERDRSEQQLGDALTAWSLSDNREWIGDGVRRGEPFLPTLQTGKASMLAREMAPLAAAGYVALGPYQMPVHWFCDAAHYRRIVTLVAEHVLALPDDGDAEYVPKACGDLAPLLALWPHVLALPTTAPLSIDELIVARAWPIHPLGVVLRPTWADGRWCSPAEFFFHDVDHARFKVREDLLARGITIADAYRDGSTFDASAGAHRSILAAATPHVPGHGWRHAALRARRARGWLATIASEPQQDLAEAARWLLFEMVHEKSKPIDGAVLCGELATSAHVDKLLHKCAAGFYAAVGPSSAALARVPAARPWLVALLAGEP